MTDPREPIDQAERLRRLQERRAASTRNPSTKGHGTTAGSRAAARRRHPAGASRIFLAGLSVASFFGIGGTMLLAGNHTASVATPAVATPAVAVVQPSTNSTASSATAPAAATSTKSTAAPVVHTKTRAS
jgi:hypothetical protein